MAQDFYELLGVGRSASADEIKKAYRKLAMQHHPDRNPGDKAAEKKFKEINHAYDILKDEQKRAAYDRYGAAAFEGGAGPNGPGAGPFGGGGFDFSDIFEQMFGGGDMAGRGRSSGPARGNDLRYNLEISLEEAFAGSDASVRVPSSVSCDTCHGSGAEPGSRPVNCPTCQGRGRVRMQQGFFTIERTCPTCHGAGQKIEKPCRVCHGAGRVRKDKTLNVKIPSGVEDGTRIRLAGEGEAGARGGPPGDLYVFLSVRKHRLYERDGADLLCRVPISMVQAALGGSIEVPTLDGKMARVSIPAGTQAGHQFRLRGKGMPVLRTTQKGDLYIETVVETPVNLTARQKELLKEFDAAGKGNGTSPESEGFFNKVKEMFGGD
ncbi:molecular chaperone DnaJ [Vineibacter terrae]|uniref:Chaperone protein DnaJ n=1 Tax=Vineibacter terrae TaxID=2586908 RepID=A0A5C8PI45_9HYPH|nr:molecular chaperone DnaJ [Vineibacter terrae]TXL73019.1 molecular chaperone DnaJ [Vineibacter terrae]HEX2889259.1 molecular chaperone DnaJ [Vineibacter terrae]